jgi:hypothetical protein
MNCNEPALARQRFGVRRQSIATTALSDVVAHLIVPILSKAVSLPLWRDCHRSPKPGGNSDGPEKERHGAYAKSGKCERAKIFS